MRVRGRFYKISSLSTIQTLPKAGGESVSRAFVLLALVCVTATAVADPENAPSTSEFLSKLPEILLVLFTGLLVVFTGTLWWATRGLVRSAEATAERQLRAYVFPEAGGEIHGARGPSTTQTLELDVRVKNYGQTPAYGAVGNTWVEVDAWPLPDDFQFEGPPASGPIVTSAIPPGGWISFHAGTNRPFDKEEIDAIRSGQLRIYIYGNIRYRDAFDKPRITNFCYESSIEASKGFVTAIGKSHRHNDAT
jgi:hypothetical protein